jgi:nucleoside-diphosphate kinase
VDRTLFVVKPHAVERGLVGTFLTRFERMGLRIAAIKVVAEGGSFWERFYPSDDSWYANAGSKTLENCKSLGIDVQERLGTTDPTTIGKMVKQWLVDHLSSGESIAVALDGNEALNKVRIACGKTLPNTAQPGTIRFDFSSDSPTLANEEKRPVFNLVHASDPEEVREGRPAVLYELGMFFPELGEK